MPRPAAHDVLFEPVRIGPVIARNRFYQVAHCNGMGRHWPTPMAAMRAMKAEGGWAVVCTEQCDIHPSSNITKEIRLWDEQDIPYLARTSEMIHSHGGLAGIELVHSGHRAGNLESRDIPIAPSVRPVAGLFPITARAMDKQDIRDFRRWHRTAAMNARAAGFDLIYVYAGHDLSLLMHFLSRRHNRRSDEYGGSLENRVRLLREVIEDTKDAVGATCAVPVRIAVDELLGPAGICAGEEGKDVIALLAELPDLWDVNISAWENDSQTARFAPEGYQEEYTGFVKSLTTKPVVGVGRYTSPDHMAALIRKGALDFIGAARPSIADPFLPNKIAEGRSDEIRECIGCNICVSSDKLAVPLRCTQNPTMGEEWRRGWHPEYIPTKSTDDTVLIIGAGPAGLEAARALGQRGYEVTLTEAARALGGRVSHETRLPGLASWSRVRDWRIGQLDRLSNVAIYRESVMDPESVREANCSIIAVATGATWRGDGMGRWHSYPIPGLGVLPTFTPDDILAGTLPEGPVLIFDDDHYYIGGTIAELLRAAGRAVTLITAEGLVSAFTQHTLEQARIQRRLLDMEVTINVSTTLTALTRNGATVSCAFTGRERQIPVASVVLVTTQIPNDALYDELIATPGLGRIERIGDCLAPGTIAAAVHSGHRFARNLTLVNHDHADFQRENVALAPLTARAQEAVSADLPTARAYY